MGKRFPEVSSIDSAKVYLGKYDYSNRKGGI